MQLSCLDNAVLARRVCVGGLRPDQQEYKEQCIMAMHNIL